MKRLREKHVLRRAVKNLLPKEIVSRKKRGLRAPIDQWLREKLPDFAVTMLSGESLARKGYFRAAAVQDLLKRHRAGERDCGAHLLGILAVQLWDELFMKSRLVQPTA
jgi:asparagine synthase (glutamine-hydrolysing)